MNDLASLLEGHIPRLRRYAHALVRNADAADDLVQDTLQRALSKSHLWQPESDLRVWLFTLMHNQHVDLVRRAVRERSTLRIETTALMREPAKQHGALQLRDLRTALDRLSDDQRTLVLLIGLVGMTYTDVAAILHLPVGTIRSRLSCARQALRELMDEPMH